jgi:hypothetical protein
MSELLTPPVIPSAILNFFASQPDFAAVAGDMEEEFQQRAQRVGARRAKLWYWRESFRNACALTARELYRTPARTAVIAFGGFLAVNMATGLYNLNPYERILNADLHFDWYPRGHPCTCN